MTQTTHHTSASIAYLGAHQPLGLLADVALRTAVTLTKWRMRRTSRRKLAQLDDHILRDIGLSRSQAERESQQRFWRA